MTTNTMTRKELQTALKEIREDWDIDINLRATTEKLQEIYEYWITSGRIAIKREVKSLHKARVNAMKNPERRTMIESKIDQLWAKYDALDAPETTDEVPQDASEPVTESQDAPNETMTATLLAALELTLDEQVLFEILQDGVKYPQIQYESVIMTVIEMMAEYKQDQTQTIDAKIKALDYFTQRFNTLHGFTMHIYA